MAALGKIGQKLSQISSDVPTIRTGTVVTDMVQLDQTLVVLDNDPSGNPVNANAVGGPLPAGSRVACLTVPPRGLLILGVLEVVLEDFNPDELIVITATRSFTEAEVKGASALWVRCLGGGGAGGGTAATAAGSSAFGSGGSSGGYAEGIIPASSLVFPFTATVGAGGTGVNGASGNPGGTTSFDAYVAASGGGGGQVSASSATPSVSAISTGPGVGTLGSVLRHGNFGLVGFRLTATAGVAGMGGPGVLGGGITTSNFTTAAGVSAAPANGSGAGGGGAYATASAASQQGGNGASGSILVQVLRSR